MVVYDALDEYGWYRVSTEEGLGYVSGEYVTIRTEFRVAESKEEEKERLEREEAERQAAAAAAEAARKARAEEERKAAEAARKAQQEAVKTAAQQQSSEKTQQQSQNAQHAQKNDDTAQGSSDQGKNNSQSGGNTATKPQKVSNGQAVVNYAAQFVGNPYVYGGSSLTNGADCSGFVMSVYAAFGISLPHSSSALRSVGYGVSLDAIQPGDIVCYSGHVGIYAGNNTLLHASSPSSGIKYTSPVNYREILSIRRIF